MVKIRRQIYYFYFIVAAEMGDPLASCLGLHLKGALHQGPHNKSEEPFFRDKHSYLENFRKYNFSCKGSCKYC